MYMFKKQLVLQLLKENSNIIHTCLPPKFTLLLTFCSIILYISKKKNHLVLFLGLQNFNFVYFVLVKVD